MDQVTKLMDSFAQFVSDYRTVVEQNTVDFFTENLWKKNFADLHPNLAKEILLLDDENLAKLPSGTSANNQNNSYDDGECEFLEVHKFQMLMLRNRLDSNVSTEDELGSFLSNDVDSFLSNLFRDAHNTMCNEQNNKSMFVPNPKKDDETSIQRDRVFNDSVTKQIMGKKKSHEVAVMAQVCARLCGSLNIQQVIDLGSGKGYLGQFLALQCGLNVVSVDSSETNTNGALKRSGKLAKRWTSIVKNAEQKLENASSGGLGSTSSSSRENNAQSYQVAEMSITSAKRTTNILQSTEQKLENASSEALECTSCSSSETNVQSYQDTEASVTSAKRTTNILQSTEQKLENASSEALGSTCTSSSSSENNALSYQDAEMSVTSAKRTTDCLQLTERDILIMNGDDLDLLRRHGPQASSISNQKSVNASPSSVRVEEFGGQVSASHSGTGLYETSLLPVSHLKQPGVIISSASLSSSVLETSASSFPSSSSTAAALSVSKTVSTTSATLSTSSSSVASSASSASSSPPSVLAFSSAPLSTTSSSVSSLSATLTSSVASSSATLLPTTSSVASLSATLSKTSLSDASSASSVASSAKLTSSSTTSSLATSTTLSTTSSSVASSSATSTLTTKPAFVSVTGYVDEETEIKDLLTADGDISHFDFEKPFTLVGLHTCGDLAPSMLRIFSANPSMHCLVNVGCCYHLLTERFAWRDEWDRDHPGVIPGPSMGFPLSGHLRGREFALGRCVRMAANLSADRLSTGSTSPEDSTKGLFYRAVLQVICKEHFYVPTRQQKIGKLAPKCKSIVEYTRRGLRKLGMDDSQISDELIESYAARYQRRRRELVAYNQLRAALAPSIEALILLDRLCYLLEQPSIQSAHIVRLFDPVTSPRCYAIIATKNATS